MMSIVVSGLIGATVYAIGAQVGLEFGPVTSERSPVEQPLLGHERLGLADRVVVDLRPDRGRGRGGRLRADPHQLRHR